MAILTEVKQQTTKALREARCLNKTVWKNKHIDIIKSRIYKIVIRPIMTYTAETLPDPTLKDSWIQAK